MLQLFAVPWLRITSRSLHGYRSGSYLKRLCIELISPIPIWRHNEQKNSILGLFISIIILVVVIYLNRSGSSSAVFSLCGGILFLGSLVYIFISHRITADEAAYEKAKPAQRSADALNSTQLHKQLVFNSTSI